MKKFLIISTGLMAAIIVGLLVTISMLDLNQYKPKLQEAVKKASGYDLKIDGDIKVSFSPVGLSIKTVKLAVPNKKEFASFDELAVAVEILPLLSSEYKVKYVVLSNLDLNIKKDKNAKFNFEVKPVKKAQEKKEVKQSDEKAQLPLLNVGQIRLDNANVLYTDEQTKSKASVKNIDVVINDISLNGAKEGLKALALKANVDIKKLTYNKYNVNDISLDFALKNAVATLKSMKYTIFGSKASANAKVDMSGKVAKVDFEELIPNLKLENFSKEILDSDLLKGVVNSELKASFRGLDEKSAKKSMNGYILLDGKSVGINGYDIDKIAQSLSDLKSGDLKKTGTSLLTNALENSASGKDPMGGLKGGTTALNHLHVKADIKNGIVNLSDVAMSSLKNRIALKGSINLVNESLNGVKVAILDEKGCAKYSQGFGGTISNPKGSSLETTKVSQEQVQEVVGMISSFFGKSKKKAEPKKAETKCTPFYNGVVKHP
ncbi:AsmA family protein [Sulfurospirillum sp. 1307]